MPLASGSHADAVGYRVADGALAVGSPPAALSASRTPRSSRASPARPRRRPRCC
ncbi:hypothetical protein ACFSKM_17495 [Ancylobacter dichloromethanicus]